MRNHLINSMLLNLLTLLANSPMINFKYIMPIVCCPKLKLSKSKFKIHPFSLNSFRVSFKLHQDFLFKDQMNPHKHILNLKLHYVTNSTYHSHSVPISLPPTILIQCQTFSSTIHTDNFHPPSSSNIPLYRSSSLHYK